MPGQLADYKLSQLHDALHCLPSALCGVLGVDFEPSASCWEVEQSLGGDDITRLLAICWADACLDNNLDILVLHSADTTLPPNVLPFRHATLGVDVRFWSSIAAIAL